MLKADCSRTCKGCQHVVVGTWVKGDICYRCDAPGRNRGYVVGIGRLLPYIPAWCPKKNLEVRDDSPCIPTKDECVTN